MSGLDDPDMRKVIASHTCDIVVMHHLDIPTNKQHHLPLNENPVTVVYDWAKERIKILENEGIARERIIFDVGIGFGKTAEQSLILLKNSRDFHSLGTRLLVGHSRKSFLSQFTPTITSERDIETIALTIYLATQNIDYLRVHNVDANARALKVVRTISKD